MNNKSFEEKADEEKLEHLIKLIAWHADDWNGKRCQEPDKNPHCELAGSYIRENKREQCINIKEKGQKRPPCGWEISAFGREWRIDANWRLDYHNIIPKQSLVFLLTKKGGDKGGYYLVGVYLIEKFKRQTIYADIKRSLKLGTANPLGPFPKQSEMFRVNVTKFGQGRTFAYINNKTGKNLMENITKELEEQKKPQELIERAREITQSLEKGPISDTNNISKLINAINTKPFIILSGISGTGKTQIARIISAGMVKGKKEKIKEVINPETLIFDEEKAEELFNSLGEEKDKRIAFLPVRPDWIEAKKVFGYYNPLTGLFYPTDGLNVLLNAFRSLMAGDDKKYFIILDEMNLARVEYYFSDILSLMENMWKLKEKVIQPGEVSSIHPILDACLLSSPNFPKDNLVDKDRMEKICWLVNKDECKECVYYSLLKPEEKITKYGRDIPEGVKNFNPIPPRIAYPENLIIIGTVNVDETTFSFAPKVLDRAFPLEFTDVRYDEYLKDIKDSQFYKFVKSLQDILKPKNMHFGYRVIDEMRKYLEKTGVDLNEESKDHYDFLLKSKILPKLHGTEEQIGDVLSQLRAFCKKGKTKDIPSENREESIKTLMDKTQFIYSNSAQKLWQMYQNMKATGYCSYF